MNFPPNVNPFSPSILTIFLVNKANTVRFKKIVFSPNKKIVPFGKLIVECIPAVRKAFSAAKLFDDMSFS